MTILPMEPYKSKFVAPDSPTRTILSYLAENRNVDNTITSISVNLKISKHQVVGSINYLVTAGLVERSMVDTDYGDTIKCVYITEKGLIEITKLSTTPESLPIEFVTKAFTITVQESMKALSQVIIDNIDNGCNTKDIGQLCKGIIQWEYDYNPSPSEVYNEMIGLNNNEEEKKRIKKQQLELIENQLYCQMREETCNENEWHDII